MLVLDEAPLLEETLREARLHCVEVVRDPADIDGSCLIIVNLRNTPLHMSKIHVENSLVLSSAFAEIQHDCTWRNLALRGKKFDTLYVAGIVRAENLQYRHRLVLADDNLPIGIQLRDNVYLLCVPCYIDLLLDVRHVLNELSSLYDLLRQRSSELNLDEVARQLSRIIVEERKKRGLSKTLQILHMCSQGMCKEIDNISPTVLDILERGGVVKEGHIDHEKLHSILKRVEMYVYVR